MAKRLTPQAQDDRDDFNAEDVSCSCHISPPCGKCTHPGNPLNQEDDECWEEDNDSVDAFAYALQNVPMADK